VVAGIYKAGKEHPALESSFRVMQGQELL